MEQLLDVYRVTDSALRGWVLDLASTANERGWVAAVRNKVPQTFRAFLDMESALVARRQFVTLLVPGLLQTAEFTRALVIGIHPDLAEEEVERRVSVRITRQRILSRTPPLDLHFILDAGVFERPIGSRLVMRNQLRRLAEATESPNITIQVLPKSAGAGPGLEGPFSILTLPDPMPDVVYTEGPGGSAYHEGRDDVRENTLRFGRLTQQALSPAESVKFINDAVNSYG